MMKLQAGERCDECPLCYYDESAWRCKATPRDKFNRHEPVSLHVRDGTTPEWCSPFTVRLPASFEEHFYP